MLLQNICNISPCTSRRLKLIINKEGVARSCEVRISSIQTEEVQLDRIRTLNDETIDDSLLKYLILKQWTPENDEILIKKARTALPLQRRYHLKI